MTEIGDRERNKIIIETALKNVPTGWRVLKDDEVLQSGDKCWFEDEGFGFVYDYDIGKSVKGLFCTIRKKVFSVSLELEPERCCLKGGEYCPFYDCPDCRLFGVSIYYCTRCQKCLDAESTGSVVTL